MLNYITTPADSLHGRVTVPGDKSISHRALMLGAIANGVTDIEGMLMGEDNLATLHALETLGVKIEQCHDGHVIVHGVGLDGLRAPNQPLNMGNSGTAMRLLTGLLSGQAFDSQLIGDESLTRRPMKRIAEPLTKMGANITLSDNGTAPIEIAGNASLHGMEYTLPVASAQVKASLLLAGMYAATPLTIIEPEVCRDHTELMLQAFGYPIKVDGKRITIEPGGQLQAINIHVPGDISSAAFFMVAASIAPGSQLLLANVGMNPTRIGVMNILKMMGADIQLQQERVVGGEVVADVCVRHAPLIGIEIPTRQVPLAIDEFPAILIAAACARGKTVLRGARELRVKETDRIDAMAQGLRKLGIQVEVLEDGMVVQGGQLTGGEVNSCGDHRIAMAFAVAGCVAQDSIIIHDCHNVATSFPNFTELAGRVGFYIARKEA